MLAKWRGTLDGLVSVRALHCQLRWLATQPKDRPPTSTADSKEPSGQGKAGIGDGKVPGAMSDIPQAEEQPSALQQQITSHVEVAVRSLNQLRSGAELAAASVADRLRKLRSNNTTTPAKRTASASDIVSTEGGSNLTPFQRLQHASRLLNELTGYSEVEVLKQQVTATDQQLTTAKHTAAYRKQAYESAVERQIQLQRDLNKLLERKGQWSDEDVQRFAALCRDEGKISTEVQASHASHEEAVAAVEIVHEEYMAAMRERYTAEQLWGDKIRRAATWYTWGLMGLQFVSFVAVVLVVEPRRVRLLHERVRELLEAQEGNTAEQVDLKLKAHMSELQRVLEENRVDLVMQTLSGGGGPGGAGHHQQEPQLPKVDTAKMMGAVATFMDGVHQELVQQRQQLMRMEALLPHASHASQGSPAAQSSDELDVSAEAEALREQLGGGEGDAQQQTAAGLGAFRTQQQGGMVVAGRRLTIEQVVCVSAAVSAGVGAVLGVLIMSYFSGR